MPRGRDPGVRDGDAEPGPTLWQRLLAAIVKAPAPGAATANAPGKQAPGKQASIEDLGTRARYADDKERLIGLIAAPFAAVIGILVTSALIANNPPARLKNGLVNKAHVNVSAYHELLAVLLVLAVLMLATAWFRKRLYLGIIAALYGLAVFNLRYWGFGIPFIMVGAWLLVRSYRMQRDLREATGDAPASASARARARRGRGSPRDGGARRGTRPAAPRPQANKRYTPPSSPQKRPMQSKPGRENRDG